MPVVEKELFLTNTQQACHQRIQSLRRDWIITASNVSLIFRVKQHNKCSIFQNLAERKPNTNMKIPEYRARLKKDYYQRVLLSRTKVKCCLVQHLNKVLQTGHVDFVFHRLRMNKSLSSLRLSFARIN